jgi:hypothetical protein
MPYFVQVLCFVAFFWTYGLESILSWPNMPYCLYTDIKNNSKKGTMEGLKI